MNWRRNVTGFNPFTVAVAAFTEFSKTTSSSIHIHTRTALRDQAPLSPNRGQTVRCANEGCKPTVLSARSRRSPAGLAASDCGLRLSCPYRHGGICNFRVFCRVACPQFWPNSNRADTGCFRPVERPTLHEKICCQISRHQSPANFCWARKATTKFFTRQFLPKLRCASATI